MPEHRCANCYVAQYQMKSDVKCKNEWWSQASMRQAELMRQLEATHG